MQTRLRLWDRVLFCDWHGVLSSDPFWGSILAQRRRTRFEHRVHQRLNSLFQPGSSDLDDWMRGQTTADELMESVRPWLGRRNPDFMRRRLTEDCLAMEVDLRLFRIITELSTDSLVVIATDNSSEFEAAFRHAQRAPRQVSELRQLSHIARLVDDLLCSSSLGVLKSEDPVRFFGPWLEAHGLTFEDALLIDDRGDNCDQFRAAGGSTVQWTESDDHDDSIAAIRSWSTHR
jgi:hypothetical protein